MAALKVSKSTIAILKNFSKVQSSILLVEGKAQQTMEPSKAVVAQASFPEAWPKKTGIYDLNKFLGVLSLFGSPSIEFGDSAMTISEGKSRIKFRYSDPSTIKFPPAGIEKKLPISTPAVEFNLADTVLEQMKSVCELLELPTITISVEAGDVVLRASDIKNSASHAFEYVVPAEDTTVHDAKAKVELSVKGARVKMLLAGSYRVSLGNWSYGYFKHASEDVAYWIVGEA